LPRTDAPASVVNLCLAADLANVRLARLVSVAVGRLHGIDGPMLDDVRLAVSEACGRAVLIHNDNALPAPVVIDIDGSAEEFSVTVTSQEPVDVEQRRLEVRGSRVEVTANGGLAIPETFALLGGLADEVDVRSDASGTTVQMRWRLPPPAD